MTVGLALLPDLLRVLVHIRMMHGELEQNLGEFVHIKVVSSSSCFADLSDLILHCYVFVKCNFLNLRPHAVLDPYCNYLELPGLVPIRGLIL